MIKKLFKPIVERSPRLTQFYRNSRDLLDRSQPSMQTPWGFNFSGHAQMASGNFEPEETKLVRELLQEVDILVNIGANAGYYCCHALNLGKPVIAVEPIARNLHYLLRNITENGWAQQAEIFPVALGAQADVLNMWGGGTGASLVKGWAGISESYVTSVPVLTMDRVLGDTLRGKKALILVDIEGAELMMLQGANNTLDNEPRPVWMVEVSTTEHQPDGVETNPAFKKTFEQFFDRGYRAYTADRSGRELKASDVEEVAADLLKTDVNNYIFR